MPPDALARGRPTQKGAWMPTQKGAWMRKRERDEDVVATVWSPRADGIDADDKGLTMERACIACGGSGLAEHVDRTLPPPPCRLCHPAEAALHLALARETRTVAAARRLDAYQTLRAAVVLGDVVPPTATPALLATNP
jgi:ribosomal protein S27AE